VRLDSLGKGKIALIQELQVFLAIFLYDVVNVSSSKYIVFFYTFFFWKLARMLVDTLYANLANPLICVLFVSFSLPKYCHLLTYILFWAIIGPFFPCIIHKKR